MQIQFCGFFLISCSRDGRTQRHKPCHGNIEVVCTRRYCTVSIDVELTVNISESILHKFAEHLVMSVGIGVELSP